MALFACEVMPHLHRVYTGTRVQPLTIITYSGTRRRHHCITTNYVIENCKLTTAQESQVERFQLSKEEKGAL